MNLLSLLHFLNTKAKPFVVFFFSLLSLGLLIVSTLAGSSLCREWYGLIVGILLMLLAIPFHWRAKKNEIGYLISFLLNSVGSGFSVSAYYSSQNIPPEWHSMLLSAVFATGVLFLVYVMLQGFGKTKKVTVTVAVLLNLLLLIAAAVLWIGTGSVFFSFGFFSLWISLFYLCVFGITVGHDERSVLRDVSFGSFGSFIILTVVVIFILSEGDILDGLDLDIGGNGKNKHKKSK